MASRAFSGVSRQDCTGLVLPVIWRVAINKEEEVAMSVLWGICEYLDCDISDTYKVVHLTEE